MNRKWTVAVAVLSLATVSGVAAGARQRLLLNAMESPTSISAGGWHMGQTGVSVDAPYQPTFGLSSLKLSGVSEAAQGMGNFTVGGGIPGTCLELSVAVRVDDDSNALWIAPQVVDAEGEVLMAPQVPLDFTGWKEIQFDLSKGFKPAWPQKDKNGRIDFPIRGVHLVWASRKVGASHIVVDGLTALTELDKPAETPLSVTMTLPSYGERSAPLKGLVVLNNFTDKPAAVELQYQVSRDPQMSAGQPPMPVWGKDEALGRKSWTERDGKIIATDTLTDGSTRTAAELPWGAGAKEVFQYVDLGRPLHVIRMSRMSGDANWIWNADISSSLDGKTYTPVPGLTGLNWHKEWAFQWINVPQPFEARYLRLRYYDKSKSNMVTTRMPATLSVYDGTADESPDFPKTGEVLGDRSGAVTVSPNSFAVSPLAISTPLDTGAYLVAMRSRVGTDHPDLTWQNYFVMPRDIAKPNPLFGLDASRVDWAKINRRLGVGWVRYETITWPMVSPKKDYYAFDGSVKPWGIKPDEYLKTYHDLGIQVLPMLGQTAFWDASVPDKERPRAHPPKNFDMFGQYIYQVVARYGSRTHPASDLLSNDKKSGMNLMTTYELWNEPNLNAPSWGPWVAPFSRYLDLFRVGAEAVKRADPSAIVSTAGLAGASLPLIDQFRTYSYPDGKHPLDFAEVLNFHTYTGANAPEASWQDVNSQRGKDVKPGESNEQQLRQIADWRDHYKPSMKLWITETGYGNAGPHELPSRLVCAYTPRNLMIILGSGIDKVFVFRESSAANPASDQWASYGMTNADGSLKPVWFSYATLIRQMDGATNIRMLPHADPDIRLCAWDRDGKPVLAAWAVGSDGKPLRLDLGKCTVTSTFGHATRETLTRSTRLSQLPVYISDMEHAEVVAALREKAKAMKAERRQHEAELAKLRTYLFDFGPTGQEVGVIMLGEPRPFTPISEKDILGPGKTFGFLPRHGVLDPFDRHWIKDVKTRDGVKMGQGSVFQFTPEAGQYTLEIGVSGSGHVIVDGGGAHASLDVPRETGTVKADVTATGGPIRVSFEKGFNNIYWLTMIQNPPGH